MTALGLAQRLFNKGESPSFGKRKEHPVASQSIDPECRVGLVSVITAVKNRADTIAACLRSVSTQEALNVEHIVIDGGSSDGTREVLGAFSPQPTYWVSEPDTGLYSALNKGLQRSNGAWICFLGADDVFTDRHVLRRLLDCTIQSGARLVSSLVRMVDTPSGQPVCTMGRRWDWTTMLSHQGVVHPGLLHSRGLFVDFGLFDERLKYVGDYEFLLRLGPTLTTAHVDMVSVAMGNQGMSNTKVLEVLRESYHVQKQHPSIGRLRASRNFFFAYLKAKVRGRI